MSKELRKLYDCKLLYGYKMYRMKGDIYRGFVEY